MPEQTGKIKWITSKCVSNILSLENFINELLKYRFTYRDIVEPLLSHLMKYLYGCKLQIDVLKYTSFTAIYGSEFQNDAEKFLQFPTLNKHQNDYLIHIDSYLNFDLLVNESISQQIR